MNNDKISENNKSKRYYPERTVCDMTFDEETIQQYVSNGMIVRIRFKRCVFNLTLLGIRSVFGCAFDQCEFNDVFLARFYVFYSTFSYCFFDSGTILDVDVFHTVFTNCDCFDLTLKYTYFSDSNFRGCECDLTTKQSCSTAAVLDCKLWQSDGWIDLPDCFECTEDTPFFQLQKTIEEDWEEDEEEEWGEDEREDEGEDEKEKLSDES